MTSNIPREALRHNERLTQRCAAPACLESPAVPIREGREIEDCRLELHFRHHVQEPQQRPAFFRRQLFS
jgi:hypothetical protein